MKTMKNLTLVVLAVLLAATLVACGPPSMQDIVDDVNSDEDLHNSLAGLYAFLAEARGDSTIALIFRAEMEELATPEVAQLSADTAGPEFQNIVLPEMRNAGISDPIVVLEYQDMDGVLIYSREFS